MRWGPAIAGKRGRCKCGAAIQVPASIAPAVPVEQEEDLLSALEVPIKPIVEPNSYANEPTYAAATTAAPTLAYARPAALPGAASEKTKELVREIYIPMGVLVLGYAGILAFLAYHGAFLFAAIFGTMILASVLMVAKTLVLSVWAWAKARTNGGSFGHPLGTVLKIAGLVVSLDAATLWAIQIMMATGVISGRHYVRGTVTILFLATFAIAAVISYLAYGLRDDEATFFSRFMASGNLTMNVLLLVVGLSIARSAATAARQANYAPAVQAASEDDDGTGAPTLRPPVRVVLTPADRRIDNYMLNNAPYVVPPKEWPKSPVYKPEDAPVGPFLAQLAATGSPQVRVDTLARRGGVIRIIVELPTDPDRRDACCGLATDFRTANPQTLLLPEPPTNARFMVIDVIAGPSLHALPTSQPATTRSTAD
ncbi:MAG TPA: hypothetical protein VGI81_11400 [Tepidisphaeraceae bacterium]